jgi:hypothetical protein
LQNNLKEKIEAQEKEILELKERIKDLESQRDDLAEQVTFKLCEYRGFFFGLNGVRPFAFFLFFQPVFSYRFQTKTVEIADEERDRVLEMERRLLEEQERLKTDRDELEEER